MGVVLICSGIAITVDAAVVSFGAMEGRKILGMLTAAAVVTLEQRRMVCGPCYSVGGIYKRELFTLPPPFLPFIEGE